MKLPKDAARAGLRCCAHDAACAVHQSPYDAGYAECTCVLNAGSIRHARVVADGESPALAENQVRAALPGDSPPPKGSTL
jgi:hypothetical protein